MNRSDFAKNIAASLARGPWSDAFIKTELRRRLPQALHPLADVITAELLFQTRQKYAPSAVKLAKKLRRSDGFERAYRYCQRRNTWPAPDLTSPIMAPLPAFADLDIPHLATTAQLADWLFLPLNRLEYLADLHARYEEHGETAINHYHYVLKRKKTGRIRVVEAPKNQLKTVQRQILRGILDKLPNHACAFGFIKHRGCVQAASKHVGEDVVVSFDLKDFFPSISAGRVFGLFRCLGYPHIVARYLTALCTTATPPRILARLHADQRQTYRGAHLPQGAPTSPALANHVCFGLDRRLSALARSQGAQ